MSYEFRKLSEVEAMTEVPEGANMIAEVNGQIKRVPAATGEGGGSGGEQTFDITFTLVEYNGTTYAKADKTQEEVSQAIKEGKRINAKLYFSGGQNEKHAHLTPSIQFNRVHVENETLEEYKVDFYYLEGLRTSDAVEILGIQYIEFSLGFYKGTNRDYVHPIGRFTINGSSSLS